MDTPVLLSIVEMGGYPDFAPIYRSAGFRPEKVHSMRKAQAWLRQNRPAVVVAEFHFDPELRDRMSNLETLLAGLQRFAPEAKVVVLIERKHRPRLQQVAARYAIDGVLDYPVDQRSLEALLGRISGEG